MKRTLMTLALGLAALAAYPFGITHGPYLQNLEDDEVTIVWTTDQPSIGWVELAPNGEESFYALERQSIYDTTSGVKTTSTIHTVKVRGLKPGTRYRYRVCSREVTSHEGIKVLYGDYATTDVYRKKPLAFVTSDRTKTQTSFAVVNDIHGDNDRLEKLFSQAEAGKPDFYIFNGDMVSISGNEKQVFDGFMDKAISLFASERCMYYTRGNHETRGIFATRFHDYFSPKKEEIYYTFRQGPVFFVVLDTGEDKPDSDVEYYDITDYDNYRSQQSEWLKGVLASKEYQEAPFKVVIAHIPPIVDWHGNLEVMEKFASVLGTNKPDVMFCAHEHKYMDLTKPSKDVPFPLVVNAHTSVLMVQAGDGKLDIQIVDTEGKTIDKLQIRK